MHQPVHSQKTSLTRAVEELRGRKCTSSSVSLSEHVLCEQTKLPTTQTFCTRPLPTLLCMWLCKCLMPSRRPRCCCSAIVAEHVRCHNSGLRQDLKNLSTTRHAQGRDKYGTSGPDGRVRSMRPASGPGESGSHHPPRPRIPGEQKWVSNAESPP